MTSCMCDDGRRREEEEEEEEEKAAGYRTKNKNPTQRCGGKQEPHTKMWGRNRSSMIP